MGFLEFGMSMPSMQQNLIDCARLVVKIVHFQCPIQLYKQLWKGHDFPINITMLLSNTNIKWAINLIHIPKLENCGTHPKKKTSTSNVHGE